LIPLSVFAEIRRPIAEIKMMPFRELFLSFFFFFIFTAVLFRLMRFADFCRRR